VKSGRQATDGRWVRIEDMPASRWVVKTVRRVGAAVIACMPSVPVGMVWIVEGVIHLKVVLLTVTACYTVADGVLDPLLRLQLAD
jgi:hypothetical protein